MNYNLSGINGLQGVQQNQAASVNRAAAVNNMANSVSNRANMSATKTQQTYMIQDAPRQFLNLMRSRQGSGAYQSELQQAESKDAVARLHTERVGSLLTDLKQSGTSESGYILKHLDKLNTERSKFMATREYGELPWLNAPAEAEEAQAAPAEETAPAENSENPMEDDTGDTREAKAAGEDQTETPATRQTTTAAQTAATASHTVDIGTQGSAQAGTIAANLIT